MVVELVRHQHGINRQKTEIRGESIDSLRILIESAADTIAALAESIQLGRITDTTAARNLLVRGQLAKIYMKSIGQIETENRVDEILRIMQPLVLPGVTTAMITTTISGLMATLTLLHQDYVRLKTAALTENPTSNSSSVPSI